MLTLYYIRPAMWSLQLHNTWKGNCLQPYDLLENWTVKTALPEDGTNERRNSSQY